ncbi:MAG TPA: hypothetical protein VHY37_11395 [Tepidisphaeraceae bacterium]|jgi:hypothetical protein|nr:hypothetical protein [Tepidisphaeraceae bacterium]
MPMSLEEQIRQHKINRDHALRLRAAERNTADGLEAVERVAQAVAGILERLAEKGLLTAEEADALRGMIGPVPVPVPSPADAPPEPTDQDSAPIAEPSLADTQAAALAAIIDEARANEQQTTDDASAPDQA